MNDNVPGGHAKPYQEGILICFLKLFEMSFQRHGTLLFTWIAVHTRPTVPRPNLPDSREDPSHFGYILSFW